MDKILMIDDDVKLAELVAEFLKEKKFDIEIKHTPEEGLSYLEKEDIDLIILCLGANDMLRGIQPKETKSNLEKIIKIAQDKNIEIILAGMIAPTSHGFSYKKKFDKIFPDLAKKFKIVFIPFLLEGVAMKPEFNLSDGIHPNEKGTIIISRTLEETIIKTYNKKN